MVPQEGTGLEEEKQGFRSQRCCGPFCDPGNSPDPESGYWGGGGGGQTGASVSGGERAVSSPLPFHGSLRILDVGEAAGPFPSAAAACLSPWQPGQKTNLPGSRLRELTLEQGFNLSFWKPIHCHSQEPLIASPSHCMGRTLGQPEKILRVSFINSTH